MISDHDQGSFQIPNCAVVVASTNSPSIGRGNRNYHNKINILTEADLYYEDCGLPDSLMRNTGGFSDRLLKHNWVLPPGVFIPVQIQHTNQLCFQPFQRGITDLGAEPALH